jgi:hypothetical protein
MAGTTNFLVFNEANDAARTFNDSEYNEATQRLNGVTPGMAISRLHNKLYLQTSAMARAIAEAIIANGDDCMDNDIPAITASLEKLIDDRAKAAAPSDIPIGTILMYAGNGTIPDKFLGCDGAALDRTTYARLYAVIGDTYGSGDGLTTFNLPDYTDGTFPEGSTTAGTAHAAGLPNITGNVGMYSGSAGAIRNDGAGDLPTSAIYGDSVVANGFAPSPNALSSFNHLNIDASRSSPIYGASTTVQPKSLTTRFIIKAYEE